MTRLFVFLLCASIFLNLFLIHDRLEQTRVTRVIDADTFVLKTGERIRLLALDAPDRNACLGEEATAVLSKLLLGKRVWLEEKVRDDYGRVLAVVFVSSPLAFPFPDVDQMRAVSVNEEIVKGGLATFSYSAGKYNGVIKKALQEAKEKRLGIYSGRCLQKFPPDQKCTVKGNIDASSGKKFYHLPHCSHYKEIIINTALGEQWFCSEREAQEAKFQKAAGC